MATLISRIFKNFSRLPTMKLEMEKLEINVMLRKFLVV